MGTLTETIEKYFETANVPVLFAGAGVAAHAELPTWENYLTNLAAAATEYDQFTKYQIDKSIADGKLDIAASYFYMCQDIPDSTKHNMLVAPLKDYDDSKLYDLISLPFSAVVTTNFDRSLLDAYARWKSRSAREVNTDDPSLNGALFEEHFYIARIHGRMEIPSSLRLEKHHFDELCTNSSYIQFLTHIFTRCSVLFVGFSFMDPAITAVLRSVKSAFKNMHGKEHLALVPESSPADFISELERHDIRKIKYSDLNNHEELWNAISHVAKEKRLANAKVINRKSTLPFSMARKYLATAYARIKIGGKNGPLSAAMAEGMISGIIHTSYSAGITEDELVAKVKKELAVTDDIARTLVGQSVMALMKDNICSVNSVEEIQRYVGNAGTDNSYEDAINRLVEGSVNRYVIREKGSDSINVRTFLRTFFMHLILKRGWDLGAAFAGQRMPEDVAVYEEMQDIPKKERQITLTQLQGLAGAVEDLLLTPDDAEAILLAELGSLAFGLELLIEAPRDALFYKRTLPERIYLDANVLMPAIVHGHPHKHFLEATIKSLQKATSGSLLKTTLCVFRGFLNEIISHRQLAIEAMRENEGEGAVWAEREVSILGSANVNVYIGAYFNVKSEHSDLTFDMFIERYAPYKTEGELRNYLEIKGFDIIRDDYSNKKDYPGILHALEVFYASGIERMQKSPTVIAHDAAQLALLSFDVHAQKKSLFVSADRRLRVALEQRGFAWLANSMITHLGLAQLVDLLIGGPPRERGMSSLLWMSNVSTDTHRIRNHLLALALREHNAAMTMDIGRIVDIISDDASIELESRGMSLAGHENRSSDERALVHGVLGRYEADFFKRMRAEMERIERRLQQ